ncbi:MAG: ATP-binding domain-containing protein, partial [Chloroflexi bacterium]|nr:ATP-binding domain-containing protein [Chloroflexota bacterium]
DDSVSLYRIINTPSRGIGPKTLQELELWAGSLGLSSGRALLYLAEMQAQRGSIDDAQLSARSARLLLNVGQMLAEFRRAYEERTLAELLGFVLERTGYLSDLHDGTEEGENRVSNVRELFTAVERYEHAPAAVTLPLFLEEAALVSDVDEADWDADAVTLLTLHAAKGLEFDTVFIVGLEEGICPHSRSLDDPESMEEERRLAYVGITRAKRRLYLLRAFRRNLYGSSELRDPSRFLLDIPPNLLAGDGVRLSTPVSAAMRPSAPSRQERRGLFAQRRARVQQARETFASMRRDSRADFKAGDLAETRNYESQAPCAFGVGEQVLHPLFGSGTVVSSKRVGDDEEVTVAFEGRGVKRLMASFANLQKK